MKKLKLKNCDEYFLIDDCDFEIVNKYKWRTNSDGYPCRTINFKINGKWYSREQPVYWEIMNRKYGEIYDHINRNILDNRRKNLRLATRSENLMNRPPPKNNSSGYKGVAFNKKEKKFRAKIRFNNKSYELGSFKTAREAALAYNKKAKELTPFAYLNVL